MKGIEEAAILNLQYEKDFLGRNLSDDMVCRAYIKGATEQKAIDEEVRLKKSDDMTEAEYEREVAFADWYNKNGKGTPTFSDAIEWARKEAIDKACKLLKAVGVLTDDDSIMGFIKAMEEDNGQDWNKRRIKTWMWQETSSPGEKEVSNLHQCFSGDQEDD